MMKYVKKMSPKFWLNLRFCNHAEVAVKRLVGGLLQAEGAIDQDAQHHDLVLVALGVNHSSFKNTITVINRRNH